MGDDLGRHLGLSGGLSDGPVGSPSGGPLGGPSGGPTLHLTYRTEAKAAKDPSPKPINQALPMVLFGFTNLPKGIGFLLHASFSRSTQKLCQIIYLG